MTVRAPEVRFRLLMAHVVVLEEDPTMVSFIVSVLSANKHTSAVTSDLKQLMSFLSLRLPDVAVLGEMRRIDNSAVCRDIKFNPALSSVKVILVVSGLYDLDDVKAEGAPDGFVMKPFTRQTLATVLNAVL